MRPQIYLAPLAIAATVISTPITSIHHQANPLFFYRISVYSDFYLTSRPLSAYNPCPPVVPRIHGGGGGGTLEPGQDGVAVSMEEYYYQYITYRYDVAARAYGRYSFVRNDNRGAWMLLDGAEKEVGRCEAKMLDDVACVDENGKQAVGQWLFECHFEGD